jgi:integrase/recombinase XerC
MSVHASSHMQSFVAYLKFEKRYSAHTVKGYSDDLFQFFDFLEIQFGSVALHEISHSFVRSWLASLKEQKLSSRTLNRKISSLRSFFKYHLKQGTIAGTPMSNVVAQKISKRLPQFVEQKDINTLFNHMEFPDTWKGRTDRLILSIFYNTGIRLSELINIKVGDMNTGSQSLKILGKGNKERVIPINSGLVKEIVLYSKDRNELPFIDKSNFLLVSEKGKKLYPKAVYTVVKSYLSMITSIDKKSPHILRHTIATHLTNLGADLNAIKELLGHNSIASTQLYTHNSIEKLKSAYKKAHPKA